MSLIFENIKKKISKKKYLEINFTLNNYKKLLIVDENIDSLKNIVLLFNKNNKYDGNIFLFGNNIRNKKKYFYFEDHEYGFYNDLNIYQNFNKLLKLFKITINKEEMLNLFKLAKIENKIYSKLDKDSQKRCKLLFKYIVSEDIFIIDLYKYKNLDEIEDFYKYLINNSNKYFKNRFVVVLSKNINKVSSNCDKVLVLSEYKQVYYGDIETLKVIKELVIIELHSKFVENFNIEINVDFKIIDNKIIIRKIDMERVLYYLVENNISILSINDFNENTNIYR